MTDRQARRALMKPVQLLAIAGVLALFAGGVAAVSMGVFTDQAAEVVAQAWTVAGIIAGVAFIATLLILAMLLLAVNPADVAKQVDRAVLLPEEDEPTQP